MLSACVLSMIRSFHFTLQKRRYLDEKLVSDKAAVGIAVHAIFVSAGIAVAHAATNRQNIFESKFLNFHRRCFVHFAHSIAPLVMVTPSAAVLN